MVDSKVFSVISLKGGVGKTTVVANLGAALACEFNKKVLIVDANFSTPHLGLHVGLVDPERSLHPVLKGEYSVHHAVYEHPSGFHVIPGKLAQGYSDDFLKLKECIDPLREMYDVIIIDSSPSLNEEMLAAMEASDEIVVVSSPDYPTLSSTLHAIDIAKNRGSEIRGLVLNKVRGKRFELKDKDVSGASEVDVLCSFLEDEKVLHSLSRMVPVVIDHPKREISHQYKNFAGSLVGEEYHQGIFSGL